MSSQSSTNFATATEDELLRAVGSEVEVSDSGKKPTFIFGTGLTIGLSNRHRAASWSGLLREVLKSWMPHVKGKSPEVSAPAWVLTMSNDGDCLVAAAYVLRRQMIIQSAIRGAVPSMKDFATAVRNAVEDLCDAAIDNVGRNPTGSAGLIGSALKDLGDCVRRGKARVLTTNYDDLIARLAGLKILLPDGRYFPPGPTDFVQEFTPPHGVPEVLRRMSAWMNIEDCAAKADEIACVLHLHGWHGQEDAVVIDPETYHEICKLPEGAVELKARILLQCNSQVAESILSGPVIYYGMGAGMMDQHFEKLRAKALCLSPGQASLPDLSQSNFWLLTQSDYREMGPGWYQAMGERQAPRVVAVKDHSEMENLLIKVIDRIKLQ